MAEEPHSGSDIARQAATGVMWMTAQTWLARAGSLVTIAILSRILAPEAFGLVAVATALLTLTYVLSDLGLSTYVVQAPRVDEATLTTAFWVSVAGGVILSLAVLAGAAPLADLLRVPEAAPIIRSMVAIIVLITLTSVPLALLRRRMAFRLLALQSSAGALLAQISAILAAVAGLGVWALVIQLLVGQIVTSAGSWISARWRPRVEFSRADFGVMVRYGANVVGTGLVSVARSWAETGIITAGLGIRELGYWSIAQRLVQTGTELSGSAVLPVSTVAFAKVNSSKRRLTAAHGKATAVAQTVVTPLMVFIAVSAAVLVPFVFGTEWFTSAALAPALALAAVLSFGNFVDRGLLDGAGAPGRWFVFSLLVAGLSILLTALSARHAVILVAYAALVTATVEMAGRWVLIGRFLGTGWLHIARPFIMVLPAASCSAAAGMLAMHLLRGAPPLVALAVTGLAMVGVHVLVTRLISPQVWSEMVALLPRRRPHDS
ncbi:Membrane protein involved in the export of O-antigen and teichoic acid [Propionibacterium cyclohexanicum]|uniref:Membrane protein involved in the export of O-antigen and teichoic acid n=1 Tax=Propionibacterium cyclohexanicum TaxID=64702 RepID=A0A1H9T2L8_9ACTN|nr:oligosaccharide flippase family protein [Propionibacterium cyclohexanicum]SER91366.1 Membrane protein involved in the export of O-antigen and teichoic acid [Propionibacterium cyclohexanicum]